MKRKRKKKQFSFLFEFQINCDYHFKQTYCINYKRLANTTIENNSEVSRRA